MLIHEVQLLFFFFCSNNFHLVISDSGKDTVLTVKHFFLPPKSTVKDNGKENKCAFQKPFFPLHTYQHIANGICTIHF